MALAASGAGLACVLAAPSVGLLYPLLFVAGFGLVPALGAIYNLASKLAPPSGAMEAFGWVASGTQTGISAGAALGGVVLQQFGTTVTAALAAACVLLAATVVVAYRARLAQARAENSQWLVDSAGTAPV